MPSPVRAEIGDGAGSVVTAGTAQQAAPHRFGIGRAAGEPVHLVHHQNLRNSGGADLGQHRCHVRGMFRGGGRGDIHHVQDQRGFSHLFERGAERLHQRGGQIADEAHGVADQHAAARGQHRAAARWDRAWRTCGHRPARRHCVRRLNSVDLPALVYPARARVASGTALRRRRCRARPARTPSSSSSIFLMRRGCGGGRFPAWFHQVRGCRCRRPAATFPRRGRTGAAAGNSTAPVPPAGGPHGCGRARRRYPGSTACGR